jgi:hypothetical protein
VVDFAVLSPGSGPLVPAIRFVQDKIVFLALQRRLGRLVLFQPVEIFKKQEPGCLLGVVQFGGAAGLFSEDVVDIFEGLFEHGNLSNVLFLESIAQKNFLSLNG